MYHSTKPVFKWRLFAALIALLILVTSAYGCAAQVAQPTPSLAAAPAAPVAPAPAPVAPPPAPAAPVTPAAPAVYRDSNENIASYLSHYFSVDFSGGVTTASFVYALKKVQSSSFSAVMEVAGGDLTALAAIKYAVTAANMIELVRVYTAEKTAAALAAAGVSDIDSSFAPYVACALDSGMISAEEAKLAQKNGSVDAALANTLVMATATVNGTARHYLGFSDDPEICSMFVNAWEQFEIFDDEMLSKIGAEAVINGVTTGYNLRNSYYDARFLPELTLRYGHSDIKHALQLLGLLKSEGIVARVQFDPKVSIYKHMPEWGEPNMTPTRTSQARKFGKDLVLIYATEYDMVLEFRSKQDMMRFDGLILNYAKKNSSEKGKALLYGSWWQPLYYTHVEMGEGYHKIIDNVITNGAYSLHPFCLEEKMVEVKDAFLKLNPNLKLEQVPIWCDAPFYRYLNGESE